MLELTQDSKHKIYSLSQNSSSVRNIPILKVCFRFWALKIEYFLTELKNFITKRGKNETAFNLFHQFRSETDTVPYSLILGI